MFGNNHLQAFLRFRPQVAQATNLYGVFNYKSRFYKQIYGEFEFPL